MLDASLGIPKIKNKSVDLACSAKVCAHCLQGTTNNNQWTNGWFHTWCCLLLQKSCKTRCIQKTQLKTILGEKSISVFWYIYSFNQKKNFSEKTSQQHGEHHHHQLANKLLFFSKKRGFFVSFSCPMVPRCPKWYAPQNSMVCTSLENFGFFPIK